MYRTARDTISNIPRTDRTIVLDLDETLVSTQEEENMQDLFELKILSGIFISILLSNTFLYKMLELFFYIKNKNT